MSNQADGTTSTSIFASMGAGPVAVSIEAQESVTQVASDAVHDLTHQGSLLLGSLEQRQTQAVQEIEQHQVGAIQDLEQHQASAVQNLEQHHNNAIQDIEQHREEAVQAIEARLREALQQIEDHGHQQQGGLENALPGLIATAVGGPGGAVAAVVVEAVLPVLKDIAMQLVRELVEHELSSRGHH